MIRCTTIALIAWLTIMATACAQWGGSPGLVSPPPSCCPDGNCDLGPLVPVAPIGTPWQPPRRVRAAPAEQLAAVARIQCGQSMGSAVLVADGIVLTVNHAVAEGGQPILTFPDGQRAAGTVIGTDPTWDVAVLAVRSPSGVTPLEIAPDAPPVGTAVTLAGYPHGSFRAATGRVTGYASPFSGGQPANWLEASAIAGPGHSGGPILDTQGRIVALNWGGESTQSQRPGQRRVYSSTSGGKSCGTVCTRLHEILRRFVRPQEKPECPDAERRPQLPPAGGVAPGPLITQPAPITIPVPPSGSPRPTGCRNEVAAVKAALSRLQAQLAAVEAGGREGKQGPAGPPGAKGERGERGERGNDGRDGKDGKTPDLTQLAAKLPGFRVEILDKQGTILQATDVRLGGRLRFELRPVEPRAK